MKYILLVICLVACTDFNYTPSYFVMPELQVYVDNFYKEAATHNSFPRRDKLEVLIQDLTMYNALGLYWSQNMTVAIDRKFFNDHSESYSLEMEAVVFHELGHALLEREHSLKVWSLMNAYYCRSCYSRDTDRRQQYLDELFL